MSPYGLPLQKFPTVYFEAPSLRTKLGVGWLAGNVQTKAWLGCASQGGPPIVYEKPFLSNASTGSQKSERIRPDPEKLRYTTVVRHRPQTVSERLLPFGTLYVSLPAKYGVGCQNMWLQRSTGIRPSQASKTSKTSKTSNTTTPEKYRPAL